MCRHGEGASPKPSSSKWGASVLVPQKQSDKSDPTPEETRVPKKVRAGKRQNTSQSTSLAARALGEIGESIVSDDELRAWRAKSDTEKDAWILKASCEILVHNMDRDDAKVAQETRLSNLEKENSQLKKDSKKQ